VGIHLAAYSRLRALALALLSALRCEHYEGKMMATQDPNVPITFPPGSGISVSQRLFSEEVGIAAATEGQVLQEKEYVYLFSNGRRFLDTD